MALIRVHVHLLPPKHPFQFSNVRSQSFLLYHKTAPNFQISSSKSKSDSDANSINDVELAMDLATEIEKIKAQKVQTQEAMRKSRKMLYGEMCLYLGLAKEELKRKWEKMEEDDKWILAEEFVSDWGSNFHPLSARSVKELVDQHLFDDDHDDNQNNSSEDPSSSSLFRGLKKIMGFSSNI